MAQSGAVRRVGSTFVRRATRLAADANWAWVGGYVRGPLLTLATAIVFDLLARNSYPVAHPFPFLLFTVVVSTYSGGLKSGLISGLVTLLYALHYLSEPGSIIRYTPTNAYSLLAIGVAVPVTVLLVARLKERAQRAQELQLAHDEAEQIDRRIAFFTTANDVLASSLD